jgi:predicted Zn-dependent protease
MTRPLAALLLSAAALTGCTTNPATGDRFLNLTSREQEIQMGAQAAPGLTQEFGGKVNDAFLNAYVTEIGTRLAAATEADNPGLPWEFTLLDSEVINAFALPGGKVFISRGLVARMTNEAQLAGVLGHEVGHVTAQHTARRISQSTALQGILTLGAAAVSISGSQTAAVIGDQALPALNVGGQLVILKFGREEESQADYLGMRYMSKIGYNPRGQLQVMEILKAAAGGAGGQPEWMSTHPLPDTRIREIEGLLAGEFAQAANNPANAFNEARFQSEFLTRLNKLPAPTKTSEREVQALIQLAAAHTNCGSTCKH